MNIHSDLVISRYAQRRRKNGGLITTGIERTYFFSRETAGTTQSVQKNPKLGHLVSDDLDSFETRPYRYYDSAPVRV